MCGQPAAACATARNFRNGCCNWRSAWTLPDLAQLVVAGELEFLHALLDRRDTEIRAGGTELKVVGSSSDKCAFHRAGCYGAYPSARCRICLCGPVRLLPSPRERRAYLVNYARTKELAGRPHHPRPAPLP